LERRIVECVANFSEGRCERTVDAIAGSISAVPGVALLHRTMDADHHRSVLTFAGSPAAVVEAAVRAAGKAAELIDLNRHSGVHPRVGAADVIPFVPVEGVTLEDCVAMAGEAAQQIWDRWQVPVYLYEAAARRSDRAPLENVRRGGFEKLREEVRTNPDRRPDIGGPELHSTAGAAIVGARRFLIAWNVNLATADVTIAKQIARKIRASSGGFAHVKALGLSLSSRGLSQVSINLTDFETTPLHTVYDTIRGLAEAAGVQIAGSEIIGLIPRRAIEGSAAHYLKCENFRPDIVIEHRIAEALNQTGPSAFLESIADPSSSTGGGSASAMAGALGSALGTLMCRLLGSNEAKFEEHRVFFLAAAKRDADAFAALMHHDRPSQPAIVEATLAPLEIAERALTLEADLKRLDTPDRLQSDIDSALALASAARIGAESTTRLNLKALEARPLHDALQARLDALH
jgi:glutamate formiminotransferase